VLDLVAAAENVGCHEAAVLIDEWLDALEAELHSSYNRLD
jgi:hypothetical protein